MVETDDRYIELAAGIQGCPGGQVRVADFDQIGLKILQDIAPGRQAQRKAVAVAERQGRCRYLVDTVVVAGAGAGDQQAVTDTGSKAQAAVFGIKIGTHAATGRGVEHGDVSDVHDQHPSEIVSRVCRQAAFRRWRRALRLTSMKDSLFDGVRQRLAASYKLQEKDKRIRLCFFLQLQACRLQLKFRYGSCPPVVSGGWPAAPGRRRRVGSIAGFRRLPG
ncbi:hypothetical protein D3C80_1465010 [compost metagenome]